MIPLLSREETQKRAKEVGLGEDYAKLNVFRMFLQNPVVARAAENLITTLMNRNTIEARTRELIILRTAWRAGSEYVFGRHLLRARSLKIPEQEILGVRDPDKCAAYSDVDRAVLKMADELDERANVSSATWAVLEKNFTPGQLVELVIAASNWRMASDYSMPRNFRLTTISPPDGLKENGLRPPAFSLDIRSVKAAHAPCGWL